MKKLVIAFACGSLLLNCTKTESPSPQNSSTEQEISNVQDSKTLYSSKGDSLQVTYFALGEKVAVKIKKNNESEQVLEGETVSNTGKIIFSNNDLNWELGDDTTAGRLSDKEGNAMMYEAKR